jgi:hypothetical protein
MHVGIHQGPVTVTDETIGYRSYLLRLWCAREEGQGVWRASLQDPQSGERISFATVEALFAYLQEQLEKGAAQGQRCRSGRACRAIARIYTPSLSPNALVFEEVWEDDTSHEAFWEAYRGSAEGTSFYSQLYELVERSTGTERWHVVEWR